MSIAPNPKYKFFAEHLDEVLMHISSATRDSAKYISKEVAAEIGISEVALSNYLNSKRFPDPEEFVKIIKYCRTYIEDFNTDYLLGLSTNLIVKNHSVNVALGLNLDDYSIEMIKRICSKNLQKQLGELLESTSIYELLHSIKETEKFIKTTDLPRISREASQIYYLENSSRAPDILDSRELRIIKYDVEIALRKYCDDLISNIQYKILHEHFYQQWQSKIDEIEKKDKSYETNPQWLELMKCIPYLVFNSIFHGGLTSKQLKIAEEILAEENES